MVQFIYFPCSKSGKILKGFCPTVGDGNHMLNDVISYRKFGKKFGIKYYAFKIYSDSDLSDGISSLDLNVVKL